MFVEGATLSFVWSAFRPRVIGLGPGAVDPTVVVYLNRLSDLLFVMARAVNHRAGVPETEW